MAGKRLLDAARLIDAGLSIAKHHLTKRQQQWTIYSRTSSLVKAVRNQTDRVTVTAGAAYELAKRLAETESQREREPGVETRRESVNRQETNSNDRDWNWSAGKNPPNLSWQGQRSVSYSEAVEARKKDTDTDDGSLLSLRRREQQQQTEKQVPAVTSHTQPSLEPGIGQDTFNKRPQSDVPEPSTLPHIKLPQHPAEPSAPEQRLDKISVTQDIFPTPDESTETISFTAKGAQEVADEVSTNGFSSPRVSRMLGKTGVGVTNPYAGRKKLPPQPLPEMVAASERWKKERENNLVPNEHQKASPAVNEPSNRDPETEDIAAAISKETENRTEGSTSTPTTQSYEMRESRVPESRFGRLWQYGGLATSMAFGAVGESFRRVSGGGKEGSLMLSEGNMDRLVAKLSRMRGAALKLGQMLSFQDSKILPSTINAVLQRVQDSADYMPSYQRDSVLVRNLGQDWRSLFSNFEERPFAAASIGQVHKATLKSNGKEVAVKVQYPGVRNSIDSDLNNLSLLLTASRLLPRGLYLEKTIANARTELGWECDYEREAAAGIRFKYELLADEDDVFAIPTVYTEASGADVLTAEFMTGTAVTKLQNLSQSERDWIGTNILRLCWRELMEWRFMQTDPNWTNFLFNQKSRKIELLDFGASREFPDKFVVPYVELLIAASKGDRDTSRDRSIELGYLTGHESKDMLNAHIDSIMTLAEPFMDTAPDVYDFKNQTITDRVRSNIGLMLRERLVPPPEETYSLHRKLSGAFLLCARLKSKIRTKEMFQRAVDVWNGRKTAIKLEG